ncbi:aquaporin-like protein [Hypoxylon sp. FL0890]|nr:aquaporin-like protein [Hypoxylon sp. FL0890]
MASRRRTDSDVEGRPRNEFLAPENPTEQPDTISGSLLNASRTRSDLRGPITSRESNPSRYHSKSPEAPQRTTPAKARKALKNHVKLDAQGWVDEDYYKLNPWYGQAKKKPVFSLGKPLPRKVRWVKRPAGVPTKLASKSPEELAELGEFGLKNTSSLSNIEKQQTTASQASRARRTAAGTGHSNRRNDVGQPVFDYQPGEDNPTRRERTDDTNTGRKEDNRNYGIDSEPLGQREHDEVEQGDRDPDELRNWWARMRAKHPEPLAEFLATGIAVFMGLGATLAVNLSANQETKYGTYETECWAWGFAWMFGIYLGGGVSGAHMNPAISINLWIFRGFPWRSCLIYIIAQFAGSLVAGALAYGIYRDSILHVDPTMSNTAKSFFSTPQEWVSFGTAFFDQVVGGAIMMIAVFALGDDQNNPPGAGTHALVLGLLVTTLKFTLGYTIGSALNPASDFGPRVVAWAVGYRGPETFQTTWWFWGPWAATLLGSFIGCIIYDGLIFVGTESPINYRWDRLKDIIKKRIRELFNFVMKKSEKEQA